MLRKIKYIGTMFGCVVFTLLSLFALYQGNYTIVGLSSAVGLCFYMKSVDYLPMTN